MAIQTGIFPFTGKLGGVIGYRRDGQYLLRSMPEQVRLSPRSKRSARYFGQASRLGAKVRAALRPLLHLPSDGRLVNRLNKSLLQILLKDDLYNRKRFLPRHFSSLQGFSFTPFGSLSDILRVAPVAERAHAGTVNVRIPAMRWPGSHPGATHLRVCATALVIDGDHATAVSSRSVLLSTRQSPEAFTLTIDPVPDGVCCVILEATPSRIENGVEYALANRKHIAAEIIAVLPPQRIAGRKPIVLRTRRIASEHTLPSVKGLVFHPPPPE
ncbi:hypothetical protein ACWKWU_04185 [Chitinophaga lutea]